MEEFKAIRVLVFESWHTKGPSLSKTLGLYGFKVKTVDPGLENIYRPSNYDTDAVLLDTHAFGTDWKQFVIMLRQNEQCLPIITWGNGTAETELQAVAAGVNYHIYIAAPVKELITKLIAVVRYSRGVKISLEKFQLDRDWFLKQFKTIVQCDIDRQMPHREISRHMGISLASLYRKVNDYTGLPVSTVILYIKIEYALNLLANTEMSIGTISLKLGFGTQSYFTAAFKKVTSVTPKKFRESGKYTAPDAFYKFCKL